MTHIVASKTRLLFAVLVKAYEKNEKGFLELDFFTG
jgi:hypothetical protein